jgi:glycosyltransferase involved in cell wall biosynthesis
MRILLVATYWHYPEVAYEFPSQLAGLGHDVSVIIWNSMARKIRRRNVLNAFVLYELPGVNLFGVLNPSHNYSYVFGLPYVFDYLKPEVVDCQSHLFLTTVQAIKTAKEFRIASIVTVHGVMAKRGLIANLGQSIYLYTLGSWVFKKATLVRCLTRSDAQELMRYGCPPEKIRIVPNAVDTNLFSPQTEREEDLVVWVGRFVQEKGLEYLLKAAKIVSRKAKNVKFLLVGDGPLKAKIMKLASDLGLLGKFVRFTGPLKREEVAKILGRASVFVFPSLREGLPLSVLEAMACGTPVVGSDVPGIKDLVVNGENGLLVPARNPKMLAEALLTLLNEVELRKEMGRKARRLVVAEYSWDSVISKIEKVYYEAINECFESNNF